MATPKFAIERDKEIILDASVLQGIVERAETLEELWPALPGFTREQYDAVKSGRFVFTGRSDTGIRLVPSK